MQTQLLDAAQDVLKLESVITNWEKLSSDHYHGDFKLSFALVFITPQIADKLLATQSQNRKLAANRVLEYSRRLDSDEWTLSDALKFDSDGHLIDGQHRLSAVVKSGVSAIFPIIAGYPRDSQLVIDIGLNRTVAQIAQLQGIDAGKSDISMIRALFLLSPGAGARRGLSSPQKILSLLAEHKPAIDFALRGYGHSTIGYAPIKSVIARAWYHENHQRLSEFLYVFDTGFADGMQDSAAVSLRDSYLRTRGGTKRLMGGVDLRIDFAKRTVTALEAFLKKEPRKSIKAASACRWKVEGID